MLNKYPHHVTEALVALGKRIALARKARHITQEELASRAGMSRRTLVYIEKGYPDASIGNYLSALWAMDLHTDFGKAIDFDESGTLLMQSNLPQRIRP